jgi:DNA polymerase/3'-5' exonuclease PolX
MRLGRLIDIIHAIDVDNEFQKNAYLRVIKTLENSASDNVTMASIRALDLTKHMKDKLCGILRDPPKMTREDRLMSKLLDVHGLSREKASKLIKDGLRSVNDLRDSKWPITTATRTYVTYLPNRKLQHSKLRQVEAMLPTYMIMVGSYRRKKEYSRDIDILILDKYAGTVLHDLSEIFDIHILSKGPSKISAIVQATSADSTSKSAAFMKIDVFITNKKTYVPMLLYLTGSKDFNTKMRQAAKSMGMTLNQYGLFYVATGQHVLKQSATERDYFSALGISYLKPEDR